MAEDKKTQGENTPATYTQEQVDALLKQKESNYEK